MAHTQVTTPGEEYRTRTGTDDPLLTEANERGPSLRPSAWEPEWMAAEQESEAEWRAAHFRDLLGEPDYSPPLDGCYSDNEGF